MEDVDELDWIQSRGMKIIKDLENMAYGGRLKGLELFQLQWKKSGMVNKT